MNQGKRRTRVAVWKEIAVLEEVGIRFLICNRLWRWTIFVEMLVLYVQGFWLAFYASEQVRCWSVSFALVLMTVPYVLLK